MKNVFKRFMASILVFCMATLGLHGGAQAGIIGTSDVLAAQSAVAHADSNRDTLNRFLARDDVRQGLVAQGIDPEAARARVSALTDVEAASLAGRVDQAAAGGDILGILFTALLVLLITDILGWTKVFPFTRSIK
jgi:hypothetical protein